MTAVEQHSVRVDHVERIKDYTQSITQPAYIARLAREAATDIDRGHLIEGLRRLVAIGGLAKAAADIIEAGRL